MTMQSGMIYVAKGTQVAGPYTKAQLLEMERSGELADYQWIWEAEATGWKPLNAPPPDPTKSLHLEPAVQATPPAAASPVEMRARHLPRASANAAGDQIQRWVGGQRPHQHQPHPPCSPGNSNF